MQEGGYHSLALNSDGSIVSWGYDGHNEVSDTPTTCDFWVFFFGEQVVAALSTSESTTLLSKEVLNITLEYDITSRVWDNTDVDVNITDPDGFNGIKDIDNNNTSFLEGTLTDVVAVNDGLELVGNSADSLDGETLVAFRPLSTTRTLKPGDTLDVTIKVKGQQPV